MPATRKIAIVGAGPGGLTLARLLQMNGADVVVYERDSGQASRAQGATLDLHDDAGLRALREAGLIDAFKANYRPGADKLIVVDEAGEIVLDNFVSGDHGPERPEIDRGPLRDILINSLTPGTIMWNRRFVSLESVDGSIRVSFSNGEIAFADIVIAADGANSQIRPYVTPIRPIYSGITIVEGNVYRSAEATPEIHKLLDDGKICALGDSKSLFVVSKGDGSLAFYTGHKTDECWFRDSQIDFSNKTEVLAWFREEFSDWSGLWDALFEKAEPNITPRPQYYFPLDQTWEASPNITMIGDAAHVMPPYAGEGVNVAMLDALELAQCLLDDDFPDAHSAIVSYESNMRKRASASTQMTLDQTFAFHSPVALPHLIEFFAEQIHAKVGTQRGSATQTREGGRHHEL
jgi:2-polyprenyl-6-methoxyphenol hydroxylase-like FAD-dependent oxidoreductase